MREHQVDVDKFWKDFGKFLAVVTRIAGRLLAKKSVRDALQAVGTFLLFLMLIWLLRSMMNDEDSAGRGLTDNLETMMTDPKTLPFADDDDDESLGDSLLGGADIDTVEAQLRGQLLDFFSKYNPERTKTVDAVVAKYSRKLDELNAQLMKKYNVDLNTFRNVGGQGKPIDTSSASMPFATSKASPPTTPPPTAPEDTETRLRKFFLKYNPEKLGSVKQLVKKYSLNQLNSKLRKKYGSDLDDEARIQAKASGTATSSGNSQVASLERQAAAFFSKHRPGEGHAWVSRFVEMYKDQLDTTLGQHYGYRLDGTKVDSVDETILKQTLERFFREHNPEKLSTVDEAVSKYRSDIGKLNTILRKKYGMDLNGKKAEGTTSEIDLLRVRFVTKMGDASFGDDSSVQSVKQISPSYLKTLFERARSEIDDDDEDDDERFGEDDELSDDQRGQFESDDMFDTAPRSRKHSKGSTGAGVDAVSSKVHLLCFGLPLTGCDKVNDFARNVLDMTVSLSEVDVFKRLEHALLQSSSRADAHFDVFYDQNAIVGVASSYFFQELIATYSDARVVIAVRDVEEWWKDFESQRETWFCGPSDGEECIRIQKRLAHLLFGWDSDLLEGEFTPQARKMLFQTAYQDYYDLLLGLTPRHRRILIDVRGTHMVMESFQFLAEMFNAGSSAERWIDTAKLQVTTKRRSRKVIESKPQDGKAQSDSKQLDSESEDEEPDYLGTLHWISSSAAAAVEQHAAKAFLLGMDATGGETVAGVLENLDLIKAVVATTNEWKDHLSSASSKGVCTLCETLKNSLMSASKNPNLLFEDDFTGGAPVQLFFRQFLAYYGSSKFILTSRPFRPWLRDLRCFFATLAQPEKKSLLRSFSGAQSSISPSLQAVLLRLYGFPVAEFMKLDVSDYLLKRRYQDYVDLVGLMVPADRLLTMDPAGGSVAFDQLCRYLKMEHKCNKPLSSWSSRSMRPTYC